MVLGGDHVADPVLEGVLVMPRAFAAPGVAPLIRAMVLAAVLLAVESAAACPLCFQSANDENRTAFMLMTGFLTVLPLLLIGFAIRWYVRRVKQFEKQNRSHRRAARRRPFAGKARQPEQGRVLNAPEGYFERGYAGTPRGR